MFKSTIKTTYLFLKRWQENKTETTYATFTQEDLGKEGVFSSDLQYV